MTFELRQYIICVSAAAFISGVVISIMKKGSAQTLTKLCAGIFLAYMLVMPLMRLFRLEDIDVDFQEYAEGENLALQGKRLAYESIAEIIKSDVETYIQDRAETLNAEVIADVSLCGDEIPIPYAVSLHGQISPYAKQQLQAYIESTLGISKEYQYWIH